MDRLTPPALSLAAARQICAIAAKRGDVPSLRLSVIGGGCSGFQYRFEMAKANEGDIRIQQGEAELVVDKRFLPYLAGAEVDYVEEMIGASFQVKNPNAKSGCGCGTSFSL